MAKIQAIEQLHALRWSQRRIARELGIDRGTVGRYLQRRLRRSNAAISNTGCPPPNAATLAGPPGASGEDAGGAESAGHDAPPNAAISSTGSPLPAIQPPSASVSPGRRNLCEPHQELILAKLQQQLTAQRIFQDLREEQAFAGSYSSVRRFVERQREATPLPMRRMECAPGEEAQIDFGTGASVITPEGQRQKTHVFRFVLSHSRKAYCEVAYRQTTEDFLRCLENAFWKLGGVPKTLVIDNLRAAVKHPDWFDPELVPKLQAFCRHYGTVILPTRPRTPRHKGKIEAGVKYVKGNALKGRSFSSLEHQNGFLADWEARVADTRIHGTAKQQVGKIFAEVERAALQPLPRERFPFFHEAERKVSRDGHVEVAKAYYSVPPEYLARTVWVRWDARLVRIFNQRFEQISLHVRHEKGRFSTQPQHIAAEKISGLERGAAYLLNQVRRIGAHSHQWAQAMLTARGIQGTRVLLGLLSLTKRHRSEALEKACQIALSHEAYHLRTVRQLLERTAEQQTPLPFLEEHPLIRPLDDYAQVVAAAWARQTSSMAQPAESAAAPQRFLRHGWTKESAGEGEEALEVMTCPAAATPQDSAQQNGPTGDVGRQQGPADFLPPRSGYPSSGCSPAEPDSVSPDSTRVIPAGPPSTTFSGEAS
jgi:transposase